MKSLRAQRGLSYWGVMFGVMFLVLALKLTMAVWPVYWDNRIIDQTIVERLKASDSGISPDDFMRRVNEQLTMNNIRDLTFEDIAKTYSEGGLIVQVEYEVRRPFIANIDLVMSFKKKFDQRAIKSGE